MLRVRVCLGIRVRVRIRDVVDVRVMGRITKLFWSD